MYFRRNIFGTYKNDSELSSCRWNRDHPKDKFCPIFVLDDIARDAGVNFNDLNFQVWANSECQAVMFSIGCIFLKKQKIWAKIKIMQICIVLPAPLLNSTAWILVLSCAIQIFVYKSIWWVDLKEILIFLTYLSHMEICRSATKIILFSATFRPVA